MNSESALQLEWLDTNGLGGFASSTVAGLNTRRYHGLLTAATNPPVGRVVMLSKLEETVIVGDRRFDLSSNRYPGAIHPRGLEYLTAFTTDPVPTFTYEVEGVTVRKSVFMVHGENTTVVQYDVTPGAALEVRPLIAFRDYHSLTRANGALNAAIVRTPGCALLKPYNDLPALYLAHDADELAASGDWYYNFEYDRERERGLDFQEDLFCPCVLRFSHRGRASIIASTEPRNATAAPLLRDMEECRRAAVEARAPVPDPLVRRLTRAADQYIVQRGTLSTIVAGYHWFSDWGRDTMIALPGLTLTTGDFESARSILLAFAGALDRGMLPNRFPDAGETPEYNTVDATLWFFEAVRAYVKASGDLAFATKTLYPRLKDIVAWHLQGTRYGIAVDRDGLLQCGVPGSQLTWMDAKIGDWVVTPRYGKPVEIQALWYNALRIAESFAKSKGDADFALLTGSLAGLAAASFNALFWNHSTGCLYDCINGTDKDAAIRPNQIFAVSLHHPLLEGERARSVVDVVRRELLTPAGLRSLAPDDPAYRPRYEGGVFERDSAYHQGTVWPWLLGPFVTAYLRTGGDRRTAMQWLDNISAYLDSTCIGQIAEIADAEAPHAPKGCVAQAWSIAEILRVAVELRARKELPAVA